MRSRDEPPCWPVWKAHPARRRFCRSSAASTSTGRSDAPHEEPSRTTCRRSPPSPRACRWRLPGHARPIARDRIGYRSRVPWEAPCCSPSALQPSRGVAARPRARGRHPAWRPPPRAARRRRARRRRQGRPPLRSRSAGPGERSRAFERLLHGGSPGCLAVESDVCLVPHSPSSRDKQATSRAAGPVSERNDSLRAARLTVRDADTDMSTLLGAREFGGMRRRPYNAPSMGRWSDELCPSER
jgi:hypothetical protein